MAFIAYAAVVEYATMNISNGFAQKITWRLEPHSSAVHVWFTHVQQVNQRYNDRSYRQEIADKGCRPVHNETAIRPRGSMVNDSSLTTLVLPLS